MSITKIIELLSIETINDNSYLKIKVTTVDEQIFFWQVDEDTANSLREICKFEDPIDFDCRCKQLSIRENINLSVM